MPPPFWILCRCNECAKSRHVNRQGESICGREWNKNSTTYREHQKLRADPSYPHFQKPRRTSCRKSLHAFEEVAGTTSHPSAGASQFGQESTKIPVPGPSDSTLILDAVQIPDSEVALWKGKAIDCGKFSLTNYNYFTRVLHPKCLSTVLLAACQYLFLNLSAEAANRTLACLKSLVSDLPVCSNKLYTPVDIRTLLDDLYLTPEIKRTVCCPRCFYLYPVESPPHKCTARETRRSQKCLEPLYKPAETSTNSPTAHRYFSTQSFTEWLARFLARPGIEDCLEESLSTTAKASYLSDIWGAKMWETLQSSEGEKFTNSSGNLVFSLNVDWFNPSGNKTAGKHISLGTIALICLNLPPHLRASHENIFLAGLIPGPSEPSVTQLNHVLKPLVEELKELWTGIKFSATANYPKDGRIIRVMLGPIVCDLPAIRKVLGMAGHSSDKNLCSFCCVTKQSINILDLDQIRPRKAHVLRKQAIKWKDALTLAKRQEIFKTYGVRYSVLYELPYFNPLLNAIFEPMHNIFLGLLSHHGKNLFGLKISDNNTSNQKNKHHFRPAGNSDNEIGSEEEIPEGSDVSSPVSESKGLLVEELLGSSENFGVRSRPGSPPEFQSKCSPTSESDSSEFYTQEEDKDSISAVDNNIPTEFNPLGARFFGEVQNLKVLREVNKEFKLPTWIGRVPAMVGTKIGGKLKADEWVILFELIMIPTIIRILFEKGNSTGIFQIGLLENLLHLSSITNIVQSFEISSADIEALCLHIKSYRQGLVDMFSSFSTKPNHHLALHLPDCVAQFAPAPHWTAWSFERLNGSLASIPTNKHPDQRDVTLVKRWVTAQNLRNVLPHLCQDLPNETSRSLLDFIASRKSVGQFSQAMRAGTIKLDFSMHYNPQKLETLDLDTHEKVLQSYKQRFPGDADLSTNIYKSWTNKEDTMLIPKLVHQQKSIKFGNVTYATVNQHTGNSTIFYRIVDAQGRTQNVCGQICQIFTMSISTQKHAPSQILLWFEVGRFKNLSTCDQEKNEFEDWPHVRTHIVYDLKAKKDYIEMDAVIGHGATWRLPQGCFGITKKALLVVDLSKHGFFKFNV